MRAAPLTDDQIKDTIARHGLIPDLALVLGVARGPSGAWVTYSAPSGVLRLAIPTDILNAPPPQAPERRRRRIFNQGVTDGP